MLAGGQKEATHIAEIGLTGIAQSPVQAFESSKHVDNFVVGYTGEGGDATIQFQIRTDSGYETAITYHFTGR